MKKTKVMKSSGLALQTIRATNNEKTKFKLLAFSMKALLAFFLLVMTTLTASAQKSVVLDALSKHGIDAAILDADNIKRPDDYAFELKRTTIAAGKEGVTIAKFDPSNPTEERWTVVSIDGKSPSRSDINTFRKNQDKESTSIQPDETSYKIEKETPEQLIISYKIDPSSVSKDNAFLKDCRNYMTINLESKKLEQAQSINEKPVKIKILKAEKLNLVIKYSWNDQAKQYFPVNESLNIDAKFLGQAANVQTISEYSNYVKK